MKPTRRRFLQATGIVTTTAAVESFGSVPAEASEGDTEVVKGANFQGISKEQLNPLLTTRSTPSETVETIYDAGVEFDPRTFELIPWGFESFELREENIGTTDPAVVATLRDGYTFHDGVSVTAEDVVTTFEIIFENDLEGVGAVPRLSELSDVRAADERTVEYVYDEPNATFQTDALGIPILPAHRWREYDPTSTDPVDDGLIGSGPYAVAELSATGTPAEDRILLSAQEEYAVGQAYEGIGPFVDLDIEFFPGTPDGFKQFTKAIRQREITFGPQVSPKAAKQFQQDPCFTLQNNPADGFTFVPYNTRRRPFDDRAFRQALSTLWNGDLFAEEVLGGFGTAGDYAAPQIFPDVRPQSAEEADRYSYPETSDGSLDLEAARDLFRTADSDREYTFGSVVNDDLVTGDRELYVDGQPVTQFHSDNDGTGGQGPLELLEFNPRLGVAGDRWVADLREVGVPVVSKSPSFGEVLERGFSTFEYDFFQIALNGVDPSYAYIPLLFQSGGAFNATGYGDADELLEQSRRELDRDERETILRDVLQQAYEEQPLLVAGYDEERFPVYGEFVGFTEGAGNVYQKISLAGLRRAPSVDLSVKPGSGDPTPINPNSGGVTPVAILDDGTVDPTRIDASTVRFGDSGVVDQCGGANPVDAGEATDVNGDGETDRLFRFPTRELGVDDETNTVRFVGRLDDGSPIRGEVPVRVVGR